DSGVREFMLPLGLYRDYQRFAGEASTASKRVSLIISEALSDDGINTFTHEMTHIFDDVVWFKGHPIRSGIGGEAYARGFFESINNTQKAQGGNSSYAPIFNLNTAYQLGAGRVQNASPQRFQTPNDLQQYMRGVFDVIYTLEVMEANSTLKLSAADKALAFNTVSLISDAKEQNGKKEAFRHLTAVEAGALTTINHLVDNAITSSRIMPQGLDSSAKTLEPNGYYVIPLYQPFYAGLQNNLQATGDYSFRRHSYELLAEYGWENGLVAYASGKYPHDEAALQAIMPAHNGDMKSFKKAMYAQRAEKIDQLKPAAEFADGAAMQAAMDIAVRSDIARLKSNQTSGASFPTAGVTAIDTLKDRIFRSYLTSTNDFKTSIYRDAATSGARELWVANGSEGDGSGAGTYDRPYQNLETALARAQAGDTIRLKENVTVAGTGLVFVNKSVTIDASVPNAANGEMFTLRFRGRDLQLGANVALKNMNLVFLKDNRESGVIYQAGHELTLDNVNTLVGRLQPNQRPIIYTGVSDETGVIGKKAVLNVVNPNNETRLAQIYVGDLFQDSNIPAEINLLAKNIKIDNGIVLGSENDTAQLASVKIHSKSDFLNKVSAVPASNEAALREIIFDGVNLAQVSLSGVHNVSLKNNSRLALASAQEVEIPGTVTVSAGNTIDLQDNQVRFGQLAGVGTVRIGAAGKVEVANEISATAQFIVYRNDANWEPLLGREYIATTNQTGALRVSLEPVAAGFKVGTDSGRLWTLRRDEPELPNLPDEPDVPEVPTPPTPAPTKKPSFTQWTDLQNSADCQARTVTQTRVKTTYTYVWNEQQKKWDEQSSQVVEKQTRAMNDVEVAACAPKPNNSSVDYLWSRTDIGSGWASAKFTHIFNAGDLDRNGYEDMMLTDVDGKLWFYPAVSETAFRKRVQVGSGWNNMRQIFGGIDFNGDAKIDILGIDKLGNLYLYVGIGNGYFAKKIRVGTGWGAVQNISVAQQGFNGNPLIMGSKSGVLNAWQTDGKGRFLRTITYGGGWNAAKLTAISGDVSGDGLPDMWVVMKSGELRLYVSRNASGTAFTSYVLGSGWKDVKYFLPRTKNARIIRAVFPDGLLRQYTLLKFKGR
ncbi:MAG: ZmpA/ZmpB/ZmpC family metallo-endopeptidase, partial [Arcanobacterium sp.]|nr:ZmpA/ZmpB/ZmpC family metallo-endopeptidase [Arcanobacterium sp.]